MHLIVILICLGLDRYWQSRVHIRTYGWYQKLLLILHDNFFSKKTWVPAVTITLCLAVILLPFIVVLVLLRHAYHGIPLFLFHVIILYYCFGETHFKGSGDLNQHTSSQLFSLANKNIIAVIFWYLLLGLPGALLYRLSILLFEFTTPSSDDSTDMPQIHAQCQLWVNILLWLPARLLGLCYALAGNFMQSFSFWLKHFLDGLDQTEHFLQETGFAAAGIHLSKKGSSTQEEPETTAIDLIDRALIIILVVVALLTLGAWLG